MAKFVIADITDAKSIPQELMAIVPSLPSVPVQPLLLTSQHEYGMFEHFKKYAWVLPVAFYESEDELLRSLEQKVIEPAVKQVERAEVIVDTLPGSPRNHIMMPYINRASCVS
jgi:hypothetical protein